MTAATGLNGAAVLIANDSDKPLTMAYDFQNRAIKKCRITDAERTDAEIALPAELPARSFIVILF